MWRLVCPHAFYPIELVQGRRYAVQVLWKESNGNDYCQVAWRKVGDATAADQLPTIPSRFLSYYGPPAAPPVEPKITKIALEVGKVVVEWSGAGLQSSGDLKAWKDEIGATSPYSVTPNEGALFYRARN